MNTRRGLFLLCTLGLLIGLSFAPGALYAADSILLSRPTDQSITVNVIADSSGEISFEYGPDSGAAGTYGDETAAVACTAGDPVTVTIGELAADTLYYYRLRFRSSSGNSWTSGDEYSFRTQRPVGEAFTFTITSDSHVNILLGNASTWGQTLSNVAADQPDFEIDLGDTFNLDKVQSAQDARNGYLYQRSSNFFDRISPSAPIFLAIGNHEQEEGWHISDPVGPVAIWCTNARKSYFPNPVPDNFYSGNTDTFAALDGDQLREDYYAWQWGDALFVVLDPFWYTTTKPYAGDTGGGEASDTGSGDRWDWTLGVDQFNWLKQTIQNSSARYKFVFAHHMVGGSDDYVRGGAGPAHLVEWGGYDENGSTYGFDTQRPAGQWGSTPIHQLMVDNNVSAFFHGHDHQYAYEKRDSVVYQSMPSAGFSGNGFNIYNENNAYTLKVLPSPGHLRVAVSSSEATVDYVQTTNGAVAYSYTIQPADSSENDPPVVDDIPNQTIVEGGTFATIDLDDYVSDVDNLDTEISWTYSGNSELIVDITDRVAAITAPSATWTGSETITFTAEDPDGLIDSDDATFTVLEAIAGTLSYIGSIGEATSKEESDTLTVNTFSAVTAGDDIIVAYATGPNETLEVAVTDSVGNIYEQAVRTRNYGNGRTYIFAAYNVDALPAGSTITITSTITNSGSGGTLPVPKAAVVSVFRGLADIDPLDQTAENPLFDTTSAADPSTTPNVGPTGTTSQADELLIGAIGTNGPVEDAAGTWQNSFVDGDRAGTTGGDAESNWTISMGYRIVSATGEYTAEKAGITSRNWAAVIATFRAEEPPVSNCPGDLNFDGSVNDADLKIFAGNFGKTACSGDCRGDFDPADFDIDGWDLTIMIDEIGRINCLN